MILLKQIPEIRLMTREVSSEKLKSNISLFSILWLHLHTGALVHSYTNDGF